MTSVSSNSSVLFHSVSSSRTSLTPPVVPFDALPSMVGCLWYNIDVMERKVRKTGQYSEYLANGQWKCRKSPTGAHYWLIVNQCMTCRYCSEHRTFDNST
jgi:hypothetical protein